MCGQKVGRRSEHHLSKRDRCGQKAGVRLSTFGERGAVELVWHPLLFGFFQAIDVLALVMPSCERGATTPSVLHFLTDQQVFSFLAGLASPVVPGHTTFVEAFHLLLDLISVLRQFSAAFTWSAKLLMVVHRSSTSMVLSPPALHRLDWCFLPDRSAPLALPLLTSSWACFLIWSNSNRSLSLLSLCVRISLLSCEQQLSCSPCILVV